MIKYLPRPSKGFWRFRILTLLLFVFCLQACISWPFSSDKKAQDRYSFSSRANQQAYQYSEKFSSLQAAIMAVKSKINLAKRPLKLRLLLGRLYLLAKDYEQAEDQAKLAEKLKYRNEESKIILAHINYLKAYYDDVKLIADNLLQNKNLEKDGQAEILNLLAGVAYMQGDEQQSIGILEKTIRDTGSMTARMNLGLLYLKHAEYRLARSLFLEITTRLPENFNAQLHLGNCYAGLGEWKKAEDVYTQLYKRDANHAGLLFFLAELSFKQRHFSAAIDWLEEYADAAGQRYQAKAAAMELIEAIQLESVRHGGFAIEPAEKLLERLKLESTQTASFQSLASAKASNWHSYFVFTPY